MHTSATDNARVYEVYYLNGKVYTNDELSQVKQYANYDGKNYTFVNTNDYKTYSVVDSAPVKNSLNPISDELYNLSFWDKLTKIEVKDIDYLVQKDQNEYVKCVEIIDKTRKVENSNLDYKAIYILNAETFEPISVHENLGQSENIQDYISIEKGVVTEENMKLPNIDDYREVKSN
jgi:translation elongation factor P/translation initiation factor 5A